MDHLVTNGHRRGHQILHLLVPENAGNRHQYAGQDNNQCNFLHRVFLFKKSTIHSGIWTDDFSGGRRHLQISSSSKIVADNYQTMSEPGII
jgi:hypothetical protein